MALFSSLFKDLLLFLKCFLLLLQTIETFSNFGNPVSSKLVQSAATEKNDGEPKSNEDEQQKYDGATPTTSNGHSHPGHRTVPMES